MKKDNKKALYESIMTSVAKEVKRALNEEFNNSISKSIIARSNKMHQDIRVFICYDGHIDNVYTLSHNSKDYLLTVPDEYYISNTLTISYNPKNSIYKSNSIDRSYDTNDKTIIKKSLNNNYSGYIGMMLNNGKELYIELTTDGAKNLKQIFKKHYDRIQNKYEYSEETYKKDTEKKLNALKSEKNQKKEQERYKQERAAEIENYKDLLNKLGIDENNISESIIFIRHIQRIAYTLIKECSYYTKNFSNNVYQKLENKIKEGLLEILNEQ